MKVFLVGLLAVFSVGCAGPRITQISPDTYLITKTGQGGAFSSLASLKADAFEAANAFAALQGKAAIPLSTNEHPFIPFGPNPWVEIQFRVVDKTDPEYRRTHMVPEPSMVIKEEKTVTGDIHSNVDAKIQTESEPDLLAKLQKLGDLRKQGILTEEEFQQQKKKMLSEGH